MTYDEMRPWETEECVHCRKVIEPEDLVGKVVRRPLTPDGPTEPYVEPVCYRCMGLPPGLGRSGKESPSHE